MFIRLWTHARWCLKKIYWSISVNLCTQLTSLQFDVGDPFHGHWQLSKQGIRWPALHDRIAGLSVEFTEVTCLPLTRLWIFIGWQAQAFSQIIRTTQKVEAPLLGLAKSIYYVWHLHQVKARSFRKRWRLSIGSSLPARKKMVGYGDSTFSDINGLCTRWWLLQCAHFRRPSKQTCHFYPF